MISDDSKSANINDRALQWVILCENPSTNKLSRVFGISWEEAAALISCLEQRGIVTAADAFGRRRLVAESNDIFSPTGCHPYNAARAAARFLDLSCYGSTSTAIIDTEIVRCSAAQVCDQLLLSPMAESEALLVLKDAAAILSTILPHVSVDTLIMAASLKVLKTRIGWEVSAENRIVT